MPIANLQSYRTVALRVKSTAFASQGQAMFLENAVLANLQQKCGFSNVGRADGTPADVVLDLNIIKTGRGGSGILSNQNLATIETLLVLSDGQNGDLLGSAHIRGESSGVVYNSRPPEQEAVEVIAKTIADTLAKSGCSGPRIARAPEPPPSSGTGTGTETGTGSGASSGSTGGSGSAPVDEAKRAQAEALNEQGKEKLRSADLVGALADFQQANQLVPDARYQYNVCLAYEAQEQWPNAISACKQARGMTTDTRLVAKIDHRLELLAPHR